MVRATTQKFMPMKFTRIKKIINTYTRKFQGTVESLLNEHAIKRTLSSYATFAKIKQTMHKLGISLSLL